MEVAEAEAEAAKAKPTLARSPAEAKAARPLAAQQPRVAAGGAQVHGAAAGSRRISAPVGSNHRANLSSVRKNSVAYGRQRRGDKRVVNPVRTRVRVRLRVPVRMCGNGRTSKHANRARRQPRKPNEACQRCPQHKELDAERPAHACVRARVRARTCAPAPARPLAFGTDSVLALALDRCGVTESGRSIAAAQTHPLACARDFNACCRNLLQPRCLLRKCLQCARRSAIAQPGRDARAAHKQLERGGAQKRVAATTTIARPCRDAARGRGRG